MGIVSVYSILFSLILSLILTPLFCSLALRLHATTLAKTAIQQKEYIPYLGGLSLFFSFFVVALLMSFRTGYLCPEFKGIITGSIVIVLLGLWDDFVELPPLRKFLGQTLAVATLCIFGITTKIATIGSLGNTLVTILWVLAIINAMNLLDIMDGLCSGITVIAAGAFLVISIFGQDILACIFCSILIGAGLGFLRYNLPPAKIYLGDTGSMFVGFILAAIAIIIDYAPLRREIALLAPILILGLPLFDTAFVILMRFLHGRPLVRKSRDHFALRLLKRGLSKPKALLFMYIFGLFFAGSGLLISRVSNQQGIIILSVILFICGIALRKIGLVKIDE